MAIKSAFSILISDVKPSKKHEEILAIKQTYCDFWHVDLTYI